MLQAVSVSKVHSSRIAGDTESQQWPWQGSAREDRQRCQRKRNI